MFQEMGTGSKPVQLFPVRMSAQIYTYNKFDDPPNEQMTIRSGFGLQRSMSILDFHIREPQSTLTVWNLNIHRSIAGFRSK